MTPGEIRAVLLALLLVAVAAFVYVAFGWKHAAEANGNTATALDRTATATGAIAEGASNAQQAAHADEGVATTARAHYAQQYEELKREDPDVVAFGAVPVPARLRELARERRCARDGPGDPAGGCARDDGTARGGGAGAAPGSGGNR